MDDAVFKARHFRVIVDGVMSDTIHPSRLLAEIEILQKFHYGKIGRIFECVGMFNCEKGEVLLEEWK